MREKCLTRCRSEEDQLGYSRSCVKEGSSNTSDIDQISKDNVRPEQLKVHEEKGNFRKTESWRDGCRN